MLWTRIVLLAFLFLCERTHCFSFSPLQYSPRRDDPSIHLNTYPATGKFIAEISYLFPNSSLDYSSLLPALSEFDERLKDSSSQFSNASNFLFLKFQVNFLNIELCAFQNSHPENFNFSKIIAGFDLSRLQNNHSMYVLSAIQIPPSKVVFVSDKSLESKEEIAQLLTPVTSVQFMRVSPTEDPLITVPSIVNIKMNGSSFERDERSDNFSSSVVTMLAQNCTMGAKSFKSIICPQSMVSMNVTCSGEANAIVRKTCPMPRTVCRLYYFQPENSSQKLLFNDEFCKLTESTISGDYVCRCGSDMVANGSSLPSWVFSTRRLNVAIVRSFFTESIRDDEVILSGGINLHSNSSKQSFIIDTRVLSSLFDSNIAQNSISVFLTFGCMWIICLALLFITIHQENRALSMQVSEIVPQSAVLYEDVPRRENSKNDRFSYFRACLPPALQSTSWWLRRVKETYIHHHLVFRILYRSMGIVRAQDEEEKVVGKAEEDDLLQLVGHEWDIFRSLWWRVRWRQHRKAALDIGYFVTCLTMSCLVLSLFYDLQSPVDSGFCSTHNSKNDCLMHTTRLDSSVSKCIWIEDKDSNAATSAMPTTRPVLFFTESLFGSVLQNVTVTQRMVYKTSSYCAMNPRTFSLRAFILAFFLTTIVSAVVMFFMDYIFDVLKADPLPIFEKSTDASNQNVGQNVGNNPPAVRHSSLQFTVTADHNSTPACGLNYGTSPRNRSSQVRPVESTFISSNVTASSRRQSDNHHGRQRHSSSNMSAVVRRGSLAAQQFTGMINAEESPSHQLSSSQSPTGDTLELKEAEYLRPVLVPGPLYVLRNNWLMKDKQNAPDCEMGNCSVSSGFVANQKSSLPGFDQLNSLLQVTGLHPLVLQELQKRQEQHENVLCRESRLGVALIHQYFADLFLLLSGTKQVHGNHFLRYSTNQRILLKRTLKRTFASPYYVSRQWQWMLVAFVILLHATAIYFIITKAAVRGYEWQLAFLRATFWEWLSEILILPAVEIFLLDYCLPTYFLQNDVQFILSQMKGNKANKFPSPNIVLTKKSFPATSYAQNLSVNTVTGNHNGSDITPTSSEKYVSTVLLLSSQASSLQTLPTSSRSSSFPLPNVAVTPPHARRFSSDNNPRSSISSSIPTMVMSIFWSEKYPTLPESSLVPSWVYYFRANEENMPSYQRTEKVSWQKLWLLDCICWMSPQTLNSAVLLVTMFIIAAIAYLWFLYLHPSLNLQDNRSPTSQPKSSPVVVGLIWLALLIPSFLILGYLAVDIYKHITNGEHLNDASEEPEDDILAEEESDDLATICVGNVPVDFAGNTVYGSDDMEAPDPIKDVYSNGDHRSNSSDDSSKSSEDDSDSQGDHTDERTLASSSLQMSNSLVQEMDSESSHQCQSSNTDRDESILDDNVAPKLQHLDQSRATKSSNSFHHHEAHSICRLTPVAEMENDDDDNHFRPDLLLVQPRPRLMSSLSNDSHRIRKNSKGDISPQYHYDDCPQLPSAMHPHDDSDIQSVSSHESLIWSTNTSALSSANVTPIVVYRKSLSSHVK